MRLSYPLIHSLWLLLPFFLIACREEEKPTNLEPRLSVTEAQEITRTSALLSGQVTTAGEGAVTLLHFRYGDTEQMEQQAVCDPSSPTPSIRIEGLHPQTTYYYCLEAGNGYSQVRSLPRNFTTQPNRKPVVGNLRILNQGPLSITLQYDVTDDGGEPLTAAGFYYQADKGEEQHIALPTLDPERLRARLSNLQPQTTYTVEAYATNSIGETRTTALTFRTGQAVLLTEPGTLPEAMDEQEKYLYNELSIAGPLNGTDLRFIREMAGKDIYGAETPGRLSHLDLTDATICAGGLSYDGMHYTENNRIGYGLFADCLYLQKILLPDGIQEIGENAFANCSSLTSLLIPASTQQIVPSDRCPSLTDIEVSAANETLRSIDGILYDRACTHLLWFPEGRETAGSLPATLTAIDKYAFRRSHLKQLDLPATVKEIGIGAFYAAQIERIVLPEAVTLIANGLFQECSRLTSVTLGSQVSYLSGYCFDGCPLEALHVRTPDFPPMCQPTTFAGMEGRFASCLLYVPSGHRNIYRNSAYWGQFKQIVEE